MPTIEAPAGRRALFILALAGTWPVGGAETGHHHAIHWYAIHAGGISQSTGAGYRLSGTLGQPAPGFSENAEHALHAGFWFPTDANPSDLIFKNGFQEN